MDEHRNGNDHADCLRDLECEADGEAVQEAMERQTACA